MTLYLSLLGAGISILAPHIVHWCVVVSGPFFVTTSTSFDIDDFDVVSNVVHPTWSV